MNISPETLDNLRNFSSINSGLTVKEGNELKSVSAMKNIFARAVVSENFDKEHSIYDLSEYVSSFSNDEYKVFLMLLRFILINIIKNNLGILSEFTTLNNESTITKLISFEILEFIDNNEKDLFIYNLDKKIFCLNIFIPLKKSYE